MAEDKTYQTMIDGYQCDLMLWAEGDVQRASCFVSRKINGKLLADSLALLEDGACGEFYDAGRPVPQATLDKIEAWALENGY